MPEAKPARETANAIRSIHVEKLFGRYTYDLSLDVADSDGARVMILYGDNGSGKTTILKALFHLLSPAPNRAHRTNLATIPFKRISVLLTDGTTVTAVRARGAYVRTLQLKLKRPKRHVLVCTYQVPTRGMSREAQARLDVFTRGLSRLNVHVYYLSDDRQVASDEIAEEVAAPAYALADEPDTRVYQRGLFEPPQLTTPVSPLRRAMSRTLESVQQLVLQASNVGEANTNAIYTNVLNQIAAARAIPHAETEESVPTLRRRLLEITERSGRFSKFGLISKLEGEELVSSVERVPYDSRSVAFRILQPHLQGIEARLNALQQIQEQIERFVESLNSLYVDKTVAFDVQNGISVTTAGGQILDPDALSSGERQLLLLLCYAMFARQQATLFIIDEPEISLNVKWQRQLIRVLLDCTRGTRIQFVLATHSIELLTRHSRHVAVLQPLEDGKTLRAKN